MTANLQLRVHGSPALPTLIYLPGLHGDWTLVSSFREAVAGKVRFVEMTYPHTTQWSLDDHAQAIESGLAAHNVGKGWLIGESFGSQPAWQMIARFQERQRAGSDATGFRPLGLILVGGFVKHPWAYGAWFLRWLGGILPQWGLRLFLGLYSRYARFRHRRAPHSLASVDEFVQRRLEPVDRPAIQHRCALIAKNDLRSTARATRLPVYYLAGLIDPLVPFPFVRRWLRRHCPGYRGGRTLWTADHNALATQPSRAAELILGWMNTERAQNKSEPAGPGNARE